MPAAKALVANMVTATDDMRREILIFSSPIENQTLRVADDQRTRTATSHHNVPYRDNGRTDSGLQIRNIRVLGR